MLETVPTIILMMLIVIPIAILIIVMVITGMKLIIHISKQAIETIKKLISWIKEET